MLTKKQNQMQSSPFENILGMTNALLVELKDVLKHGTDQEKQTALNKFKYIRQLMRAHYEHMRAKMNISDEDLQLVLSHYIKHSPEMHQKILAAQQELQMHKNDLNKLVKNKKSKERSIKNNKWIRTKKK